MLDFLRQPYPGPTSAPRRSLLFALGAGVFVAGFLIVFRPFGTPVGYEPGLNAFLAGYGVIVAGTFALPPLLLPVLAPRWSAEAVWTVGKQLLIVFLMTVIGITASYFYLLRLGGRPDWTSYFTFFRNGLVITAFPLAFLVLLDYIRKLRHYQAGAADHNAHRSVAVTSSVGLPVKLVLRDSQARPVVEVVASGLWCLHAEGNYVEVWWQDGNTYQRTLIRNTLRELEAQLSPADNWLRCHRSWVVNAALVEKVTGNAQGYRLHRPDAPAVPVARGRSKQVLTRLSVSAN